VVEIWKRKPDTSPLKIEMKESHDIGAGARGSRSRRALAHAVVVVSLYAIFFAVFFSPVLFDGKLLAPGDGVNFAAPFFYAERTLWQPLLWGGYPQAADPPVMTFSPVAWLFHALFHSFNAFVVAAYVIAASTAYGYVNRLTRSRLAAAVGGLVYGAGGFLVAHQGHVSMIHTVAWVPLVFWSLEELRRAASARWFVACVASVAACGLEGHFQIFPYALGLAGLYCLAAGWTPAPRRPRRLALLFAALALGVACVAVQLIPAAELTNLGQRVEMSFADFNSFSLPPHHLARLFFPYAFGGAPGSIYGQNYFGEWAPPAGGWGPTELAVYVGLTTLALALAGVVARRRERAAWFWAGAGVLALLLAMGDATPLARLVFRLPYYNKFRAPSRHLFEFALAAAVLAGYGVAAVSERADGARLIRRALASVGALAFASLIALQLTVARFRPPAAEGGVARLTFLPWHNPATAIPLAVFVAACAALLYWGARPRARARGALLVAVLVADLSSFGWFYEWRATAPDAQELSSPAGTMRFVDEARATRQRVLPSRGALTPREGFPPNVSLMWGAPSAGGYSGLILARTSRLLEMSNDGNVSGRWQDPSNLSLDLFAVRYVFVPKEETATGPDAERPTSADPSKNLLTTQGTPTTTNPHDVDPKNGGDANADRPLDQRATSGPGVAWDGGDLNLALGKGCDASRPDAAEFALSPATRADAVALVSALACSAHVAEGAAVLRVTARDAAGRSQSVTLRAGADTSEWAHDCADVLPSVAHARAPVFESFAVARGAARCVGHSYVATARFAGPLDVKALRVEWIGGRGSADVKKISLLDYAAARSSPVRASERAPDEARWRRVADSERVTVYENLRARPRAWLASEVVMLTADEALAAIKTSRLPGGRPFDPSRTALVEEPAPPAGASNGATSVTTNEGGEASAAATVTRLTDTSVGVSVRAAADSFLVLSDVSYPGWRASVDGREVHVFQTDYALRGVAVPAGEHAVEFTFAPQSFRLGALVSACAILSTALVALLLARGGGARRGMMNGE
jgi:hypothetical protein